MLSSKVVINYRTFLLCFSSSNTFLRKNIYILHEKYHDSHIRTFYHLINFLLTNFFNQSFTQNIITLLNYLVNTLKVSTTHLIICLIFWLLIKTQIIYFAFYFFAQSFLLKLITCTSAAYKTYEHWISHELIWSLHLANNAGINAPHKGQSFPTSILLNSPLFSFFLI